MTIMFISDIHGIKTNLPKIKKRFNELSCDKLIVLGDIYNIGSRNKSKEEYDAIYIKKFLESFKEKLICIKGNCDSKADIMISKFPIANELSMIKTDRYKFYLTHGHVYNETNWPYKNSILIYGHQHTPFIKKIGDNLFINPGSISLPRKNSEASYLIYHNHEFVIYDMKDHIIMKKALIESY